MGPVQTNMASFDKWRMRVHTDIIMETFKKATLLYNSITIFKSINVD